MSETNDNPKPKGGRKRPVLIGAAVLAIAGLGAGAWTTGLLRHGGKAPAGAAGPAGAPVLVDLPDIVSNLDSGGRRESFVKLHAKLQVSRAADVAAVQADIPRILDIALTYLRSTRPEELHGGEGTYRLREALMNRIDVLLAPVQVGDLLFTEVLVQ